MRATEVIASCARRCLTLGRAREAAELYIRAATCASGERREELAKLALQISHSADEPTVTLAAFELLQNVNTDAHDDIELAVLSARIRLNLHAELTAEETKVFQANPKAWDFFNGQAPSYRRQMLYRVASAKRPETRAKRLANLIDLSAQGRNLVAEERVKYRK